MYNTVLERCCGFGKYDDKNFVDFHKTATVICFLGWICKIKGSTQV